MIRKRDDGYYSDSDKVDYRRMSKTEEIELFLRYKQEGDLAARDEILTNQLLFVAAEATRVAPDWMAADEAISAGNSALFKAIDKFDPTKGVRFASYLRKFIRGEVIRACREKAPVYFPNGREIPPAATWADQELVPDDAVSEEVAEPSESCEKAVYLQWLREVVEIVFNDGSLSEMEVHVIREHFLEGKPYQQIADEANPPITRQRIGQLKNSACAQMKKILARHGITGLE